MAAAAVVRFTRWLELMSGIPLAVGDGDGQRGGEARNSHDCATATSIVEESSTCRLCGCAAISLQRPLGRLELEASCEARYVPSRAVVLGLFGAISRLIQG